MYSTPGDPDFELPNGGSGPDPLRLAALPADFAVLLFQRDFRCQNCRRQVRTIADRYGEFRRRDAVVVSALPESKERAAEWAADCGLPFPVVADADADAALADRFGQPVRFGFLGRLHDLIGRMPLALVIDLRRDPLVVYSHVGEGPADRPTVEGLLLEIDRNR